MGGNNKKDVDEKGKVYKILFSDLTDVFKWQSRDRVIRLG